MRKRDKRDSFICSYILGGARETTTVMVPKRKSGKRTAVPQSWEVLDPWPRPNARGRVVTSTLLYTRFTPGPDDPFPPPHSPLTFLRRLACAVQGS